MKAARWFLLALVLGLAACADPVAPLCADPARDSLPNGVRATYGARLGYFTCRLEATP